MNFKKINILSIISVLVLISLLFFIASLNVLPALYLFLIVFILVVIQILGIIFVNLKNKPLLIVGIIILCISIIINSVGSYYLYHTNSFLNKSFNSAENKKTNTFYIVTSKNSTYESKNDITGDVYYYDDLNNIDKAVEKLKNELKVNTNVYNDISAMFIDLASNKINFVLIEKSSYDLSFNLDANLKKDNYKVIYKFNVDETIEVNKVSASGDSFNIYIGGNDFTNSLMDFNMIVSVNTATHEVLLTSIPRDYYIEVYGKNGRRDTLSYMGPYGIDTSIKSLENLFGIKIDYYVKINTESLVGIVDQIGGINYCSDISFTTTHATVLNTYDDTKGKKLTINKGCQQLNGIQTLTVARERNAFPGRDRVRQENCQKIMMAIFDKLKSVNTLSNYNQILSSISSLYQTTVPKEVITDILKDIINNGANFTITSQAVDGTDTKDYVHLTNLKDWVMIPNMDTVNNATTNIKKIVNK